MSVLLQTVSRQHLISTRDAAARDLFDASRLITTQEVRACLPASPIDREMLRWMTSLAEDSQHLARDILEEICGAAWKRNLTPAIRAAYDIPVRAYAVTAMALRDIDPI